MTLARRLQYAATFAGAGAAVLALGACHGAGQALGMGKTVPDEFRVVAKAPLVVPPDYSLRPPAPGEPRPQELQPESQARLALLGQQAAVNRSQGEQLLVAKAGVSKADPLIRYVVDDEYGSLSHKDRSFADTVMFWRKGDAPSAAAQASAANAAEGRQAAPVDAAAEEKKVKELTGDQRIVIAREPAKRGVKLPGL
ncbi:MAG: DUF3035 domain-containing protein [Caulobacteraceae bacterium]|nr:DUF3035 domain-containing protein [Caulobacter sp.]